MLAISTATSIDRGIWEVFTTRTPLGTPVRRVDCSAIEFGLDHPSFHRTRIRLGISWRDFRRAWNRLADGVRDRRQTNAARRVIRHAGFCLWSEEWNRTGCMIKCV